MKITSIKYTEEFSYHGASQWIGLKGEIIEGEDIKKGLYELRKQAREFFYEANGAEEKQMGTQVMPVEENKNPKSQEEAIIDGINSCTKLKVLESYSLIARNNHKIQDAYDLKLQSLQK